MWTPNASTNEPKHEGRRQACRKGGTKELRKEGRNEGREGKRKGGRKEGMKGGDGPGDRSILRWSTHRFYYRLIHPSIRLCSKRSNVLIRRHPKAAGLARSHNGREEEGKQQKV